MHVLYIESVWKNCVQNETSLLKKCGSFEAYEKKKEKDQCLFCLCRSIVDSWKPQPTLMIKLQNSLFMEKLLH